jgi:hypothetical protein
MRRLVLAPAVVAAVAVLSGCGGGGGGGGTPTPAPSPRADVVLDLCTTNSPKATLHVGQTLRLQAEQSCQATFWNLTPAPGETPPQLTVVSSGGATQPGVKGLAWALYRAVQPGDAVLHLVAGAWCPAGQPCPAYARLVLVQVTVEP